MGITAKFIILIQARKEAAAERQRPQQRYKVYGRRDRERDPDRRRGIKRSDIGGREVQGGGFVGGRHVSVQC